MTGTVHNDARRKSDEADVDEWIKAQAAGNTEQPGMAEAPAQLQPNPGANAPETPPAQTQQPAASGQGDSQQPTPATPSAEEDTWKARYSALKGKYDAEVPKLHAQIRELTQNHQAEVAGLRQQLETQRQQPAGNSATAPPKSGKSAAEQLAADFGKEVVDGFVQLIREEAPPSQQQAPQQGQNSAQAAFERFVQDLSIELAGAGIRYSQYNTDAAFNEWLNDFDAGSAVPRRDTLNGHVSTRNHKAAADYFIRYVAGLGAGRPNNSVNNPLQPHAQVPDGGAGNSSVPQEVNTEHAFQAYMAASDGFTKGDVTREEMERLEKVYYAALAATRQ